VGIEIASLTSESFRGNGVAPPPHSNWSLFEPSQDKARSALESLRALGIDTKKMFGTKSEIDPISRLIGTAVVWGGSPPSAAVYEGITPTLNDGKTALEAHSEGRAS